MSTFRNIKYTIQNPQKIQNLKKNALFNFMNTESASDSSDKNSSENTTSDDDDYDYDDIIQVKHPRKIDKNIQEDLKKYSESTRRSRSKSPVKRATRHGRRVTHSEVVEYKTISPRNPKPVSPTKSYRKCDNSMRFRDGSMRFPCRIQNTVFHTKDEWDEYMEIQLARIATTQKFLKEHRDPNYKRPHTTKSRRGRR
jgi:hypothetical protein